MTDLLKAWNYILNIQERRHPGWMETMERTMLTTGLASETGGICDIVTHLDGGGSRQVDPVEWTEEKIVEKALKITSDKGPDGDFDD